MAFDRSLVSILTFSALLTFVLFPSCDAVVNQDEINALKAIRTAFGISWTDTQIAEFCTSTSSSSPDSTVTLSCNDFGSSSGVHLGGIDMYERDIPSLAAFIPQY
jgi:hypothetical protein